MGISKSKLQNPPGTIFMETLVYMFPLCPKLLTFMTNFFYLNFSISTIMSSRKYSSGSEKRKKSKQSDAFIQTQRGALDINI